jgi:hypothetical protein
MCTGLSNRFLPLGGSSGARSKGGSAYEGALHMQVQDGFPYDTVTR